MKRSHDLCVIGAGEAGSAAALRAASHGMSVVLIDPNGVGGTSLHSGRVARAVLAHAARVAEEAHGAHRLGLGIRFSASDFGVLAEHRGDVIEQRRIMRQVRVDESNIEYLRATALVGDGHVRIASGGGETYITPRNIVVAVGSEPRRHHGSIMCDGRNVIDARQAVHLRSLPRSPLVLGAGATGIEFASFRAAMGADVTVVEAEHQLLPFEGVQVTDHLTNCLRRAGIAVHTNTSVASLASAGNHPRVDLSDGTTLGPDLVLLATGRSPIADQAGLASLGLLRPDGRVRVDHRYRTAVSSIRAIGSCASVGEHVGAAVDEGTMVADDLAGANPDPVNYAEIPRIIRTWPAVASVGLSVDATGELYGAAAATSHTPDPFPRSARSPWSPLVTIVTRPDSQITGIHVLGPDADALIGLAALVVRARCTPDAALKIPATNLRTAQALHDALRRTVADGHGAG